MDTQADRLTPNTFRLLQTYSNHSYAPEKILQAYQAQGLQKTSYKKQGILPKKKELQVSLQTKKVLGTK